MDREKYISFIDTHFTTEVVENENSTIVVHFKPNPGSVGEGLVIFEKAKVGWKNKPLTQNSYIIIDAYISLIIDFMSKYIDLDENKYPIVRRLFIDKSFSVLEEHFNNK